MTEYPEQLANKFASIIIPLVKGSSIDFSVENLLQSLPNKGTWDTPISNVDGAGYHSRPDWSHPASIKDDVFKDFRQHWMQSICNLKLHTEIENHFSQQRPEPPFTDELVNQMRSTIEQFLATHNLQSNWDIPGTPKSTPVSSCPSSSFTRHGRPGHCTVSAFN